MNLPTFNLSFCLITTVFLSMAPVGYELVLLNNPTRVLKQFVNESNYKEHNYYFNDASLNILWSFIVSCQAVGAFFGCFAAVPVIETFGRKFSLMIINNVFVLLGAILMGLAEMANSFEMLLIGRLLIGISSGAAFTILPIFITETTPPEFRGAFCCLEHTFLCLGSTLAAFLSLDYVLATPNTMGYLLAMPAFFSVLQIALSPIFMESPKYLLLNKKDEQEALESLRFYRGANANFSRILCKFEEEDQLSQHHLGFRAVFKDAQHLNTVALGSLVNFAQIFTGLMAILSYSTTILSAVGLGNTSSEMVTALGALLFTVISVPAMYFVERFGRRTLLVLSLLGITVADFSFFAFGMVLQKSANSQWASICFVIMIFVFAVCYNLGPGPIGYFIAGELVSPDVRTVALALGVSTNWISTIVSTLVFYPLSTATGAYSFLIFAFPTLINWFIIWWKLPETKPNQLAWLPMTSLQDTETANSGAYANTTTEYGTFDDRKGSNVIDESSASIATDSDSSKSTFYETADTDRSSPSVI